MHLSFALGELGLRMEEFYSMPWNEYLIKCFAWARMEKEKWRHTRTIAYYSMIGSHVKPEALPKTIERFMPLDGEKKPKVSDWVKDLANKRMQEWRDSKLKNN